MALGLRPDGLHVYDEAGENKGRTLHMVGHLPNEDNQKRATRCGVIIQ